MVEKRDGPLRTVHIKKKEKKEIFKIINHLHLSGWKVQTQNIVTMTLQK